MTRGHTTERRYGPRWLLAARWCVTVLIGLVALALFVSMVMDAQESDPKMHAAAAMVFFLLGIFAFVMGPFTWLLWRPTRRWRRTDRDGWLLQQRLNEHVRKEQLRAAAQTEDGEPSTDDEASAAAEPAVEENVPAAVDGPVRGRHRGGRADVVPTSTPAGAVLVPATQQLAVRGPEGQVVTLLVDGTGTRRREGAGAPPAPRPTVQAAPRAARVSRTDRAAPPVWPGYGTPDPDG